MDLKQLATFLAVAEFKSFTKAAERLKYAQSSVTAQVQQLELSLGVRLFERLGHTIELTAEGRRLLPYAEEMGRLTNDIKTKVGQPDPDSGSLTIGAIESICVTRLPAVLKAYRQRFPEVEVNIKFGRKSYFLEALKRNEIDLAFLYQPEAVEGDFKPAYVSDEPIAFFASPDHPLAQIDQVSWQALATASFILTDAECSYRKLFHEIMRRHGLQAKVAIESVNVPTILELAISNLGVILLPEIAVRDALAKGQLVRLNTGSDIFRLKAQIVHHKNKWLSPAISSFIELYRDIASAE